MRLSAIVAMDLDGVIGRGNELPWRLPADLKHFRRVTLGKPVLMGRRTYASIGRPLPGRHNVVITRDPAFTAAGCEVVSTPEEAVDAAARTGAGEAMVIGGAAIYEALLPRCDRLHLTEVLARVGGDVFFPPLDPAQWRETSRAEHPADAENPLPMRFRVLERLRSA